VWGNPGKKHTGGMGLNVGSNIPQGEIPFPPEEKGDGGGLKRKKKARYTLIRDATGYGPRKRPQCDDEGGRVSAKKNEARDRRERREGAQESLPERVNTAGADFAVKKGGLQTSSTPGCVAGHLSGGCDGPGQ